MSQDPSTIPTFDDFQAARRSATTNKRPALTWGAQRSGHKHQGEDFGGAIDSDVGAADEGEVIFAGPNGNMGNTVAVRHANGMVTRYGHLNKINVATGVKVGRGESIGLLGRTGNAKGPHVHYEVLQGDLPIDPAASPYRQPLIGPSARKDSIPTFEKFIATRSEKPSPMSVVTPRPTAAPPAIRGTGPTIEQQAEQLPIRPPKIAMPDPFAMSSVQEAQATVYPAGNSLAGNTPASNTTNDVAPLPSTKVSLPNRSIGQTATSVNFGARRPAPTAGDLLVRTAVRNPEKLAADLRWHFGVNDINDLRKLPIATQRRMIAMATTAAAVDERKRQQGLELQPSLEYQNQMRAKVGLGANPALIDPRVPLRAVGNFDLNFPETTQDVGGGLRFHVPTLGEQASAAAAQEQRQEQQARDELKARLRSSPNTFGNEYSSYLRLNRANDTPQQREQFLDFKVKQVSALEGGGNVFGGGSARRAIESRDNEGARQQRIARMGRAEYLAQIPKSAAIGFTDAFATSLKGIAALAKKLDSPDVLGGESYAGKEATDLATYKLGEEIERGARRVLGSNVDLEQEFGVGQVPTVLGQVGQFMLGGWVTKSPKLATVILGSAMTTGDAYDEVRAAGGSDDEAVNAALLAGGLLGPTELIGMRGAMKALEGTAKAATWRSALREALREGRRDVVENALQEVGQEFGQGVITGNVRSLEQLFQAGLLGGIGGTATVPLTLASTAPGIARISVRNEGSKTGNETVSSQETGENITETITASAVPKISQNQVEEVPVSEQQQSTEVATARELEPATKFPAPVEVETAPEKPITTSASTEATAAKQIVRHSDPNIDGGEVIGRAADGRLKVRNKEGGISLVQDPRKQGNREAAIARVRDEERQEPVSADTGAEIDRATNYFGQRHTVTKYLDDSSLREDVLRELPAGSVLSGPNAEAPEMQSGAVRLRAPNGDIWELDLSYDRRGDSSWKIIGPRLDGFAVRKTGERVVPQPAAESATTRAATITPESEAAKEPAATGAASTPAGEKHPVTGRKYSSTQVNLPPAEATLQKQVANTIPDSELAADGREDTPHVTVKYGLHTDDAGELQKVLADEPPIKLKIGKMSIFAAKEGADYDVVKMDVDSSDLHRLNAKIAKALPVTDTHPEYKPHITLAYVKPGEGAKYVGQSNALTGREITLDKVLFSGRSGNEVEIPLKGVPSAEPAKLRSVKSGTYEARLEDERVNIYRRKELIASGKVNETGQVRGITFTTPELKQSTPTRNAVKRVVRQYEKEFVKKKPTKFQQTGQRQTISRPTDTLWQFVQKRGGIAPADNDIHAGELARLTSKASGKIGLLNKANRQGNQRFSAEYMMDAANEAGYRDRNGEPFTSIGDFIVAVADDATGLVASHTDEYANQFDYETAYYKYLEDQQSNEAATARAEASADALVSLLENEHSGHLYDLIESGRADERQIDEFTQLATAAGVIPEDLEAVLAAGRDRASQAETVQDSADRSEEAQPPEEVTPTTLARPSQQLGLVHPGLSIQESRFPRQLPDQREQLLRAEKDRKAAANPLRAAALKTLEEIRRRGLTVDDYARQEVLFGEKPTAAELDLLKELEADQDVSEAELDLLKEVDADQDVSEQSERQATLSPSAQTLGDPPLREWGRRLKTIVQSRNLDDLRALSSEIATRNDDPRVAQLHKAIQSQMERVQEDSPLLAREGPTELEDLFHMRDSAGGVYIKPKEGQALESELFDTNAIKARLGLPDTHEVTIDTFAKEREPKKTFLNLDAFLVTPQVGDDRTDVTVIIRILTADGQRDLEAEAKLVQQLSPRFEEPPIDLGDVEAERPKESSPAEKFAREQSGFKDITEALEKAGFESGEETPRSAESIKYERIRDKVVAEHPDWKTKQVVEEVQRRLSEEEDIQDLGDETLFSRAYHGSPHAFDRFSTENVGSGEGFQSYGWGLYFTDTESVARHYRAQISERDFIRKVEETYSEYDSPDDAIEELLANPELSEAEKNLLAALQADDWLGFDYPHQAVQAVLREPDALDISDDTRAALKEFGRLYEVELAPEPDEYLLWDKPLSAQSGKVKGALKTLAERLPDGSKAKQYIRALDSDALRSRRVASTIFDIGEPTGKSLYWSLTTAPVLEGMDPDYFDQYDGQSMAENASRLLLEHGIRGIKYLDQKSRKHGEGSYNYVIFSDSDVEILRQFAKGWETAETSTGEKVVVGVEANRVSLNSAAARILSDIYRELGHIGTASKGVRGAFERQGEALARNLDRLADRGVAGARSFSDAVRRAAKNGEGKVVLFYGEGSRRHELFHETSERSNRYLSDRHGNIDSLTSAPQWPRIQRWLTRENYPNQIPVLVEEAAAHIAEGRYAEMGLSREEAIDWMELWFQSFARKNPNVDVREFKELSDAAEKARERVYESQSRAFSEVDENVQRLEKGREEGDRANLARARDLTQSEAFQRWFGNSKVTDKNGEPVVVYHATSAAQDFSAFDPKRLGAVNYHPTSGYGFYFSGSPDVASDFVKWAAIIATPDAGVIRNPVPQTEHGFEPHARVMPVYLRIENPLRLTPLQFLGITDSNVDWLNAKELKRKGYDGIIVSPARKNQRIGAEFSSPQYVVFDPKQIKSATGNRGSFDTNDPNILMARATGDPWDRLADLAEELEGLANAVPSKKGGKATLGEPDIGDINPPVTPPDPILSDGDPAEAHAMALSSMRMLVSDVAEPGYEKSRVSAAQVIKSYEAILTSVGRPAPIRTGRISQRDVRGIYKPDAEVIRLKTANNIPTAAHETGHALQKVIYGSTESVSLVVPGPVKRELVNLGKALYGSRKPSGGYRTEGFAEFMRYYLTRDDVATVAPATTKHFEEAILPAHPEIAKAINDARIKTDSYRKQGAKARGEANVEKLPGALDRGWQRVNDAIRRVPKAWIDEFTPLFRLSEFATAKTGPLTASQDPAILASALRATAGAKVAYMVNEGMIDFAGNVVGPPLRDATSIVKGNETDFALYLHAKRAQERWSKDKNPGMSREDADTLVAALETPEFQLAAQKVYDWNDGILGYVEQAVPSMADAIKQIRAESQYYVPLQRSFAPDEVKGSKGGGAVGGNALKRMTGSGRAVKEIFPQILQNAEQMLSKAHKRAVLDAIVRLSDIEGLGYLVEEVPKDRVPVTISAEQAADALRELGYEVDDATRDELVTFFTPSQFPKGQTPIIPLMRDGQMKWFQVDPEVYNTLAGIDLYRLHPLLDLIFGVPTRIFRLGVTGLRPAFSLLTNPMRDVQTFIMQTKSHKNPASLAAIWISEMARAFNPMRLTGHRDPFLDLFERLGAQVSQPLGVDIATTRRVSKELFRGKVMNTVTHPLTMVRELLSLPESASRTAELRSIADEIGWKPGQPMTLDQSLEMTLAAKRVTTDFSAGGHLGKVVNQAVPFFNASIQGSRTFARTIRDNPQRALLRGVLLITLPTLYLWWKNKDEEWYRDMLDRDRFLYWHIRAGNQLLRIPKAFEWGNLFAVAPEAIFDSWYQKDPEGVKAAVGHIFKSTVPDPLPVVAKAAREQWQNRIDFFDKPIVPRGELDLPPSEQRGPYTSAVATWLGTHLPDAKIQGVPINSPRRIDALIRSLGGGVAPDVLNLVGLGGQRGVREYEPSDLPVIGRLFRPGGIEGMSSKAMDSFYDRLSEANARAGSKDNPETASQREDRLLLEDANKAIQVLRLIQLETPALVERQGIARISRLIAATAQDQKLTPEQRVQKMEQVLAARPDVFQKVGEKVRAKKAEQKERRRELGQQDRDRADFNLPGESSGRRRVGPPSPPRPGR